MGRLDNALKLIGRLIPMVYVAFNLGNPLALTASIILLILDFVTWNRDLDLELTILSLAVAGLMPPLLGLAFSIPLTLILDSNLRLSNDEPWWVYALALLASMILSMILINPSQALAYAVPLAYIVLTPFATWIRLKATRIILRPSRRRLETTAGVPLSYSLSIVTKPKINAVAEVVSDGELSLEPKVLLMKGETKVKARVLYQISGVKEPRLRVRFRDLRGLVTVERVVKHPPITVISRTRAAAGYAEAMVKRLSVWGVEEVEEVKEYAPGDPTRRIHWKKVPKLNKLVVKMLKQTAEDLNIILVPYASNEVTLDKVGETLILTIATALVNSQRVMVHVADEWGEPIVVNLSNFSEVMVKLTARLRSINVKLVGGLDAWGLMNRIKESRALMMSRINGPLIIIGERTWVTGLCRSDAACLMVK
ncbi:DUF58 domain-containing protein [Caldivirga sp.]|uniref:DUF58 domain-containing protein n=1 Tax=Caldivirga sp. TaxID=2080243 RepID=UPI003D151FD6